MKYLGWRKLRMWLALAAASVILMVGALIAFVLQRGEASTLLNAEPELPLWLVGIEVIGVACSILAVTRTLLGLRASLGRIASAEEDPGERLHRRIRRVNSAFAEAATLMDELRRDLEAQQAAREALLAQAEEQQRLLAIDQEQAENIRKILIGETKATIRAERRQQWMFFTLGILASIPIGVAINLLVP